MHVKLETLRVKPALNAQIYELDALKSTRIDCIVMACMRLGESACLNEALISRVCTLFKYPYSLPPQPPAPPEHYSVNPSPHC